MPYGRTVTVWAMCDRCKKCISCEGERGTMRDAMNYARQYGRRAGPYVIHEGGGAAMNDNRPIYIAFLNLEDASFYWIPEFRILFLSTKNERGNHNGNHLEHP